VRRLRSVLPRRTADAAARQRSAALVAPRSALAASTCSGAPRPQTSEKVVLSERLEEIRATIINNMIEYHPESRDSFAAGRKTTEKSEGGVLGTRPAVTVPTTIRISSSAAGNRSALELTTLDRPGLLVDIVRVLKDCSLNVVSASINTAGLAAKDTFYVTYHGKALNKSMEQLVINALQYYLTQAQLETDESY
jgi:UTP:GlnB (protein PII) uridylyltransferase